MTFLDSPAVAEIAAKERVQSVSVTMLARAELGRALRTRSSLVLLAIGVLLTVVITTVRVAAAVGLPGSLSGDIIFLSCDAIGLFVMFCAALAVARDHQSGSIELVRVLAPVRAVQVIAFGLAHAVMAVATALIAVSLSVAILLVADPGAFVAGLPADNFLRLLVMVALIAFAGTGVGALCRSSAATTFAVLALYLLLPTGLMIAGFAGVEIAAALADYGLGSLAATALLNGPDAWLALGGVTIWSSGLLALGVLRETKGR